VVLPIVANDGKDIVEGVNTRLCLSLLSIMTLNAVLASFRVHNNKSDVFRFGNYLIFWCVNGPFSNYYPHPYSPILEDKFRFLPPSSITEYKTLRNTQIVKNSKIEFRPKNDINPFYWLLSNAVVVRNITILCMKSESCVSSKALAFKAV
jgi:hypothetical protein